MVCCLFFYCYFCRILSPHSYKKTVQDELYNPPQLIRFIDSEGNFHLRPFVFKLIEEMDMETFEFSYSNSDEMIPIYFFIQGDEYSIFGFKTNFGYWQ